jgi:excisionase family DNA binding protein
MSSDLYSVEQVAELLGLHVRTVRLYVREGRLKAVRIGKQYRIAREDLEKLTGRTAASFDPEPVRRHRHVEVSSIVEIDAIGPETANRITNGLLGAANGRGQQEQPLRVETIYNEVRAHLKVIVTGSLSSTVGMLQLMTAYLEN